MNKPYHETEHGVLYCGGCLEVLREMADESVDSIVTDPPYGLSFMGKKWDYDVPSVEMWRECLRVLKPGGHLLSFAGTRTQHRMAVRIEDAGFEIRDMLAWIYGSGFPKSLDVGKAIDKMQGAKRTETVWKDRYHDGGTRSTQEKGSAAISFGCDANGNYTTLPATPEAKHWDGFGTALKPAFEPITVARKPISEKTVAANVLMHGTGGLNIDGCRVGSEEISVHNAPKGTFAGGESERGSDTDSYRSHQGRFPANLIHDGSDEVLAVFPNTKSGSLNAGHKRGETEFYGGGIIQKDYGNDSGSAARFFYCAKASKAERNAGCEGLPERSGGSNAKGYTQDIANGLDRNRPTTNHHPTVKPIAVMQWLCRLVTPPSGTVLDPFLGSGTTAIAAIREGFRYIGIEREQEYCDIAAKRIESELDQTTINLEVSE